MFYFVRIPTLTHSLSHTHTLTHTHTLMHTPSHTHTHTHAHTYTGEAFRVQEEKDGGADAECASGAQ
jgi:hypothetical protein